MSKKNLFALIVGINEYSPQGTGVSNLGGCVNDAQGIKTMLESRFKHHNLAIELLTNAEATRQNVLQLFQSHLSKAKKEDIALFHYSGHGSRENAPAEFLKYFPEGKNETMVLYDSRTAGGMDLADKELAALLWQIAQNEPHLVLTLDCCHSGSGSRAEDDFRLRKPRQSESSNSNRSLETYLNGFYSKMLHSEGGLYIPRSKHVLLAACDRTEKAWETLQGTGVFSTTLLEVLQQNPQLSYTDLFLKIRAAVRKNAKNQSPQFEFYEHFNAYDSFLEGKSSDMKRRHRVYFENNVWKTDLGAIHGLPTDLDKSVEFAVYAENEKALGYARTSLVDLKRSNLQLLDFEADTGKEYEAEIISLPIPPTQVYLSGEAKEIEFLKNYLNKSPSAYINFTDIPEATQYEIRTEKQQYAIYYTRTDKLIHGVAGLGEEAADYILGKLENIAQWGITLNIQNAKSKIKPEEIEFKFFEISESSESLAYSGDNLTIDFKKTEGEWKNIWYDLRVKNNSNRELYFTLLYIKPDFGIEVYYNDNYKVPTKSDWLILDDQHGLTLFENEKEITNRYKIFASTEYIDAALFVKEGLELGKIITLEGSKGTRHSVSRNVPNDWLTKTLTVNVVRKLNEVGEKDTNLQDNKITVKGHPTLKAGLSIKSADANSRSTETLSILPSLLAGSGLEMFNLAGSSRSTELENVLELSDIQNSENLKENPLELLINAQLSEDELLLPLTFDGTHILPVGTPDRDVQGNALIRIEEIPEQQDNRRSLGKALKMVFFKVVLKRKGTDNSKLCWVEYKADNTAVHHDKGIAEKVAQAKKILLLVHGIIGNTDYMALSLRFAQEEKDYDLILTFDYENLNTPIEQIAEQFKAQLKNVGLEAGINKNEKELHILAHSMGGLVSRYFIEELEGNQVVSRLIMAGTPNGGSPFGKLPGYINLASTALTFALNALTSYIGWAATFLLALNKGKSATDVLFQTLAQMHEKSDFIAKLNSNSHPGIPYFVIAGDITYYKPANDSFFTKLSEKALLGVGNYFNSKEPNDVAVSVEGIKKVGSNPQTQKLDVICHHLNYFDNEQSVKVLREIL